MSIFKVSEIQLRYKHSKRRSILPFVRSADDAYCVLRNQWDENRIDLAEDFKILLLNRSLQALGICPISSGGTAGTFANPKLVFAAALKANASSIVLAHNHPSGNLQPSNSDITLTRKFENGGKILDIEVVDHIILTSEGFYSIANECKFDEPKVWTPYSNTRLPVIEY